MLNRRVTLSQYLRTGGRAILRPGFPEHLPLLPHLQLRVLAMLLNRHPAPAPRGRTNGQVRMVS